MIANYNQAAPNNAAGTIPLAQRQRPVPGYGDITHIFSGGKARYQRPADPVRRRRMGNQVRLSNSLALSQTRTTARHLSSSPTVRRLHRRTSTISMPSGARPVPPAVQQHHQHHHAASVRPRAALGSVLARRCRYLARRMAGLRREHHHARRTGQSDLHPCSVRSSSRASGTRGAEPTTTGRNVSCDPLAPGATRSITNWFNKDCISIRRTRASRSVMPCGTA